MLQTQRVRDKRQNNPSIISHTLVKRNDPRQKVVCCHHPNLSQNNYTVSQVVIHNTITTKLNLQPAKLAAGGSNAVFAAAEVGSAATPHSLVS